MDTHKRGWLTGLLAGVAALGTTLGASSARAASVAGANGSAGTNANTSANDEARHKLVYQVNHAEPEHLEHILNSVGAVLGQYGDDVSVAIVAFAAGLHLLGTRPERPIPEALRQRVRSMATHYGVQLYACGNTMKSLGWGPERIVPEAKIEEVGAATLMALQERGYAYIAW